MAKTIITIAIIVFSTTAALGAGVLVERKQSRKPVSITASKKQEMVATTSRVGDIPKNMAQTMEKVTEIKKTDGEVGKPVDPTVVASKTGKKYHFPWCSGAKRISTSSKIVFKDAAAAKKAGYEPAANCKGLE